jgi:hypothetical protein
MAQSTLLNCRGADPDSEINLIDLAPIILKIFNFMSYGKIKFEHSMVYGPFFKDNSPHSIGVKIRPL